MTGTVISMGDHDTGEADAGLEGSTERNRYDGMASPAIQLCGPYPNAMGFQSAADVTATNDYYLDYEVYGGVFSPPSTANKWWVGVQSYPGNAKAVSGSYPAWGQIQYTPYMIFAGETFCFRDVIDNPFKANSLLRTSNASGIPDSIRLIFTKVGLCFQYPAASCASTAGAYVDNISLAIVDAPILSSGLESWNLFQDTFPANGDPTYAGVAAKFDTTTAYIKTGHNIAPYAARIFDVPGDSAIVYASSPSMRVDLVFRILPGPGNYVVVGRPDLDDRLRKVPTSAIPVSSGDLTNFWSSYLADNGSRGTPGGHPTVGGIKRWNPNVWNSARCDTVEVNVFAFQGRGVLGGPDYLGWMTTYHESDPRGGPSQLGISRHRCFVATPTSPYNVTDCVHDPPSTGATWNLSYATAATGYDGQPATVEGTKILPDGMFTPGTHVEYFFRLEDAGVCRAWCPTPARSTPNQSRVRRTRTAGRSSAFSPTAGSMSNTSTPYAEPRGWALRACWSSTWTTAEASSAPGSRQPTRAVPPEPKRSALTTAGTRAETRTSTIRRDSSQCTVAIRARSGTSTR